MKDFQTVVDFIRHLQIACRNGGWVHHLVLCIVQPALDKHAVHHPCRIVNHRVDVNAILHFVVRFRKSRSNSRRCVSLYAASIPKVLRADQLRRCSNDTHRSILPFRYFGKHSRRDSNRFASFIHSGVNPLHQQIGIFDWSYIRRCMSHRHPSKSGNCCCE